MNIFQHMIRGCGNLEYCGPHPGTTLAAILVLAGTVAGARRSTDQAIFGFVFSLLVYGPLYLWGAYGRSVYDVRLKKRETGIDLDADPRNHFDLYRTLRNRKEE